MGHTHYWEGVKTLTPEFVDAVQKVVTTCRVPLVLEHDVPETSPEISTDGIRFNGVESNGHETFVFQRSSSFQFCKTARKPYDRAVTAVLSLAHHFGLVQSVTSDGDTRDWADGVDLARTSTGLDVEVPPNIREAFLRS